MDQSVQAKITGKVVVTLERVGKDTFKIVGDDGKELEIFIGDTLTIHAPFETKTDNWEWE